MLLPAESPATSTICGFRVGSHPGITVIHAGFQLADGDLSISCRTVDIQLPIICTRPVVSCIRRETHAFEVYLTLSCLQLKSSAFASTAVMFFPV